MNKADWISNERNLFMGFIIYTFSYLGNVYNNYHLISHKTLPK